MSRLLNIASSLFLLLGWQGASPPSPEVPDNLKAPAGEHVVLQAHAKGMQVYVCQAGPDQNLAWVLKGPEAELTDTSGKKIIHHSAGPTWKHIDGSAVTGKVVAKQDAPKSDAIPWLLLTASGHSGEGILSRVTSIQRLHTEGGQLPAASANFCDASATGTKFRRGQPPCCRTIRRPFFGACRRW